MSLMLESEHLIALIRFVSGGASFSFGLLLSYRSEITGKRSDLVYGVLLTLSGSVILLGFGWPR